MDADTSSWTYKYDDIVVGQQTKAQCIAIAARYNRTGVCTGPDGKQFIVSCAPDTLDNCFLTYLKPIIVKDE